MKAERANIQDIDIEKAFEAVKKRLLQGVNRYKDGENDSYTITTIRLALIAELGVVLTIKDTEQLMATFEELGLVEKHGIGFNRKPCYRIV